MKSFRSILFWMHLACGVAAGADQVNEAVEEPASGGLVPMREDVPRDGLRHAGLNLRQRQRVVVERQVLVHESEDGANTKP